LHSRNPFSCRFGKHGLLSGQTSAESQTANDKLVEEIRAAAEIIQVAQFIASKMWAASGKWESRPAGQVEDFINMRDKMHRRILRTSRIRNAIDHRD
jgi:hypothetical protein